MRVNLFQKYRVQLTNKNILRGFGQIPAGGILAPFLFKAKLLGKVSIPRPAAESESHFCCQPIPFHSFYQLTKKGVDDKIVFWSIKSQDRPDYQRQRIAEGPPKEVSKNQAIIEVNHSTGFRESRQGLFRCLGINALVRVTNLVRSIDSLKGRRGSADGSRG